MRSIFLETLSQMLDDMIYLVLWCNTVHKNTHRVASHLSRARL